MQCQIHICILYKSKDISVKNFYYFKSIWLEYEARVLADTQEPSLYKH